MIFKDTSLREWLEKSKKEEGYLITQHKEHEGCEYPNMRLLRLDCDWRSVGVTHEVWGLSDENSKGAVRYLNPLEYRIPKSICWIDDKDDGGCKSDKFERDIRMLEKALDDEPKNTRYTFFMGQSNMNLQKYDDAIKWYKKRIELNTNPQDEEAWYCAYYISRAYLLKKDVIEMEYWVQKAFKMRPTRLEPIFLLTKYFCDTGEIFKAFEYAYKGVQIKYPEDDVIFVEGWMYKEIFNIAGQLKASLMSVLLPPQPKQEEEVAVETKE
jgi:tetratricopeptide (TPR) repeat protein